MFLLTGASSSWSGSKLKIRFAGNGITIMQLRASGRQGLTTFVTIITKRVHMIIDVKTVQTFKAQ